MAKFGAVAPRQPEQDRQGSRHRVRGHLLRGRGRCDPQRSSGVDHGWTELPDRASPVPEHAQTTSARRSYVGPGALPQQRCPVRGDHLGFVVSDGHWLPEPGRARCARPLRLRASEPIASSLTHDLVRVDADHGRCRRRCSEKKRTISALAAGPSGSVYEQPAVPPNHACPAPWTIHCSRSTSASSE